MAAVLEEFERQLELWRKRYAGRPRDEMIRLVLLALEREEIVTISYRDDTLGARLRSMPIPGEERDLIRHALLWAWRDESMHAIYIRGAILRLGGPLLKLRAYAHQGAGALAGWSSSVRQHSRWRDAPLSRAAAALLTWAGTLTGQVPSDVREYLRYRPFRDYCLFNVDAEKTAWICWRRIAELCAGLPDVPPALARDFERIIVDESNHSRIFSIFADALDEEDRLRDGIDAGTLAARIGEVGENFLPRRYRSGARGGGSVGAGGRVWCVRGAEHDEKLRLFRSIVEEAGLPGIVEARMREMGVGPGALRAAIKPAFMLGYDRRDTSMITDPALVAELAVILRELGCGDVAVIEGQNIYEGFYEGRSVGSVARYLGYDSPGYTIVDATGEQEPHRYRRGMAQYTIARAWRDADLRISFAKMRSHPIELAHLTVGNVEWIGARCDEFLFAERQAERETAIMMLLDEFPPHFALLDAYDSAADGLLGVMGCPDPPAPLRLYASADPLALDTVAARHMGVLRPHDSSLLRAAIDWFGDASAPIEVMGPDEPIAGWRGPYHSELSTLMSLMAFPVYVLGSGRGALFVPPMDTVAFPPARRVGPVLAIGRRCVQRLVGLRGRR
jgi:uncharacterized protein (DUF362 family)